MAIVMTFGVVIALAIWWHQQSDVQFDELLGRDILSLTDEEPKERDSEYGEEKSGPLELDGEPARVSRGYYKNGNLRHEGSYLHDKPHGLEQWWNVRGQMISEQHWRAGYLHGMCTHWYSNGQIAEEAFYDRARLHGTYRTWYRDGQERARIEYRDGLREGPSVFWHSNGKMNCRANFSNDSLEGLWEKWNADGELIGRRQFRGGVLVSAMPGPSRKSFAYPGKLGSDDFALILAQGSGWHGYNTLRVSASGWCDFCYLLNMPLLEPGGEIVNTLAWRRTQFQLTDDMQRQLREALDVADVFRLKDKYVDDNMADGTQWNVRLRAGGVEKDVYCSNEFPRALRVLSTTLRAQIMSPHKMEILTATTVNRGIFDPRKEDWLEAPEK